MPVDGQTITAEPQVQTGQATQVAPAGGAGTANPWAEKFDSPEKMWTSYTELEKKLGTQGNELGTYKNAYDQLSTQAQQYAKAVEAWDSWSKKYDLDKNWGDVEKFLKTRGGQAVVQAATQTSPDQQAAAWSTGWETMTPQQQAQKLQEVSQMNIANALAPALQNWQQQTTASMQKEIQAKEAYFNNYLSLYRRVMDMKLANPGLDVDQVLDQAVKVLNGQTDPIELGKMLTTATGDRDAYAKQLVDKARLDWDTEQKNKELKSIQPTAGGTPPAFKVSGAGTTKGGLATLRENVAKAILEKHGAGAFTG